MENKYRISGHFHDHSEEFYQKLRKTSYWHIGKSPYHIAHYDQTTLPDRLKTILNPHVHHKIKLSLLSEIDAKNYSDYIALWNRDELDVIHKIMKDIESERVIAVVLCNLHESRVHHKSATQKYISVVDYLTDKIKNKILINSIDGAVSNELVFSRDHGSSSYSGERTYRLAYLSHLLREKKDSLTNAISFIQEDD